MVDAAITKPEPKTVGFSSEAFDLVKMERRNSGFWAAVTTRIAGLDVLKNAEECIVVM